MSESRKLNKGLVLFCALLIIAFFVVNIRVLIIPEIPATFQICTFISVFALTAAFNYFIGKYDKSHAIYYRAFTVLLMLSELVALVGISIVEDDIPQIIISTFAFAFAVTIFAGNDLGKKFSLALCFAYMAACIAEILYCVYTARDYAFLQLVLDFSTINLIVWCKFLSRILFSILLTIMTYCKYLDKEERGTN